VPTYLRHIGVSPKTFIRLTRFDRARAALFGRRGGTSRSLAEIASACGYADQSHLIKDFRALSSKLPSEF